MKKHGKTTSHAYALMLEKLAMSCLDETHAKALMMAPVTPEFMASLEHPAKLAFTIPYFDEHGKPTSFKRWRYLEDTRSGFLANSEAKPLRYVQEKNTIQEVYMPPFTDWHLVQENVDIDLVITEGELKAACCTLHYAPTLGLGGVYSFKSAKRKLPLLPVFYKFKWKGRRVLIAYDSDAHTNHMVLSARNELCKELLALGALPEVCSITPAEDNSKRGLDDVVYQEGPEGLRDLLDAAEPYAPSAALHELNSEVAYVVDPGMVIVLATGQKMRPSDFTSHAYSNRHYYMEQYDKDGNAKVVKKRAAPAWLEWPERYALKRMTYSPGKELVTPELEYNTWTGWGCEPKRGDISLWKKLLDHLFKGKPAERNWFEQWCALPLQRPGSKMYTAAVLWGVSTGTGKSLVGYTLGKIYGRNFTEIGDTELQDDRKEWAVNKQFVMGDDVTGHDQRKYADRLKKMITQREMRIDQKYVPSYTVMDVITYLFTSNHPDAFFLEDDDRRFFIHEVELGPLPNEFYAEYDAWLKGGGPSALFHHLLNIDLGDMRAEDRAPNTSARKAMIEDGLSDLGRWARRLRDEPDLVLKLGDATLQGDLWSSQELLALYDPDGRRGVTAGGLGKELKRAGVKMAYGGLPVRTQAGQFRLFALRNTEEWQAVKDISKLTAHYNATRKPMPRAKKFK